MLFGEESNFFSANYRKVYTYPCKVSNWDGVPRISTPSLVLPNILNFPKFWGRRPQLMSAHNFFTFFPKTWDGVPRISPPSLVLPNILNFPKFWGRRPKLMSAHNFFTFFPKTWDASIFYPKISKIPNLSEQ